MIELRNDVQILFKGSTKEFREYLKQNWTNTIYNKILLEFLKDLKEKNYCLCNIDFWIQACKDGRLDKELE